MNNRLSIVIIAVLLAVAAYFAIQNMRLKKQLNEQGNVNEMARIAPKEPETRPANPEGVSPFDKPNIDPQASEFKPEPILDTMPTTVLKFETMMHDFGRITEGSIVKTKFKFTNAGTRVLLITHAQASCGCTVPTTPKEPVKAGESGVIDVEFNSVGKRGETTKTITIQANTKPMETVLVIKATVVPRDN
jgi:hypothetical protein